MSLGVEDTLISLLRAACGPGHAQGDGFCFSFTAPRSCVSEVKVQEVPGVHRALPWGRGAVPWKEEQTRPPCARCGLGGASLCPLLCSAPGAACVPCSWRGCPSELGYLGTCDLSALVDSEEPSPQVWPFLIVKVGVMFHFADFYIPNG